MEGVSAPRLTVKFYKDRQGKWRWRVIHQNGRKMACSGEGYTRRIDARRAYVSVVTQPTRVVLN